MLELAFFIVIVWIGIKILLSVISAFGDWCNRD